ncbi:Serine-threonine/tyrosine-protein kinase catalytic domain containing protein [Aphelenchoides avenae]|nr:Serine-threonine/tyrosine-protein kinase catalytic domain containing protein [Aphelenchus avenae]
MLGYVATDVKRPILVFEYCSKGDARKWLQESRRLSEGIDFECASYTRRQMSLAWQVSDGMAYISALGIVHRDLAARNVLLTDGFVAKVGDFGLARGSDDNIYPSKNFGRLPVKRMAPEALKHGTFSTKSDV